MVTKVGCSYVAVGTTAVPTMVPMSMTVVLRMVGMSNSFHHSIEACVGTRDVIDHTNSAVGLLERVRSFHVVTISIFVLFLLVAGMGIVDRVVKMIVSWPLKINKGVSQIHKEYMFQFLYDTGLQIKKKIRAGNSIIEFKGF